MNSIRFSVELTATPFVENGKGAVPFKNVLKEGWTLIISTRLFHAHPVCCQRDSLLEKPDRHCSNLMRPTCVARPE